MVKARFSKALPLTALLFAVSAFVHAAPSPASSQTPPEGYYLLDDTKSSASAEPSTFKAHVSDKTFRKTLMRWAAENGWSISWELDDEYSFSHNADFGADFYKAIDGLCAGLNATGVRARAIVYQDNQVVRIVLEGAQR